MDSDSKVVKIRADGKGRQSQVNRPEDSMGDRMKADEGARMGSIPRFNRFGQESQTGGWVKYEDHERCVADLHRQVKELSASLTDANGRVVQAEERCEHLIALMAAHESVKPASAEPKGDGPVRS